MENQEQQTMEGHGLRGGPGDANQRGAPRGTKLVSTLVAIALAAIFIGVPVVSNFAETAFAPTFVGIAVAYLLICIYFLHDILSHR